MEQDTQDRVTYIIYCVSASANRYGLSNKLACAYLNRFQRLNFLDECYEAEHQLSINDAIDDLSAIWHRNGGALV